MSLGDGTQWDEANPTQLTLANTIDAYNRDVRVGIRLRMANEHEWPSSQTGSGQAGMHKFVTLQAQATVALSGTQVGGLYVGTDNALYFVNTGTASPIKIVTSTGLNFAAGTGISITGTANTISIASTALAVYDYGTSASTSTLKNANTFKVAYGITPSITGNATQAITNLPFTTAGSYRVAVSPIDGPYNEGPSVVNDSGAQCTISNNHNDGRQFQWMALGT